MAQAPNRLVLQIEQPKLNNLHAAVAEMLRSRQASVCSRFLVNRTLVSGGKGSVKASMRVLRFPDPASHSSTVDVFSPACNIWPSHLHSCKRRFSRRTQSLRIIALNGATVFRSFHISSAASQIVTKCREFRGIAVSSFR